VEQKSAGELQEHMLWTYYGLRVGLVVIGVSLPVLVMLSGFLYGEGLRGSLSDYYNVAAIGFLTPRDIFVGGLLAAAACLYLYKGYSDKENLALNLAAIFALVVAVFPTGPDGPITYTHRAAAVLFFVCITYVCLFRSKDTLDEELVPEPKRSQFARRYNIIGVLMIASPLAALAMSWWLGLRSGDTTVVLWIETFGVVVFASYWAVKTLELRGSEAERLALDAHLKRVVEPPKTPPSAAGGAAKRRDVERIKRAA
jgi:hypothetical protein